MRRPTLPFRLAVVPVALLAGTLVTSPAGMEAQDRSLSWTETRNFEVPGAFGALMARSGHAGEEETLRGVHLFGRALREDDGSSTVLIDLDARRYVIADHEARSYIVLTFDEAREMAQDMAQLMNELQADLDEARREQEEAMEEARAAMEEAEAEVEVQFTIESEATGETRDFDGIRAQRHFLTGRFEVRSAVEGVDEPEGGTLLFLADLWQSPDVASLDEIYEEWGRRLADDPEMQAMAQEIAESMNLGGDGGGEALALWDPRIAAGLEQLAEAMESLDGTTIQSSTTVALVPDGAPYDREELLAWEPTTMGTVVRRAAGDAAVEAGRSQARRAMRGATRGVLGRRAEDDAREDGDEELRIRPLFRMITSKRDLEAGTPSGPLGLDLQGYREITLAEILEEMPDRER